MFGISLVGVGAVITVLVVALLQEPEKPGNGAGSLAAASRVGPYGCLLRQLWSSRDTTQRAPAGLLRPHGRSRRFTVFFFILLVFRAALYFAAAFILLGIAWFFVDRCFGWKNIPLVDRHAARVLSRWTLHGPVWDDGGTGSFAPPGSTRSLATFAAYAECGSPGKPRCTQSGRERDGLSCFGRHLYDRGCGAHGSLDSRLRAPAVDARRTGCSSSRAGDDQRGYAGILASRRWALYLLVIGDSVVRRIAYRSI